MLVGVMESDQEGSTSSNGTRRSVDSGASSIRGESNLPLFDELQEAHIQEATTEAAANEESVDTRAAKEKRSRTFEFDADAPAKRVAIVHESASVCSEASSHASGDYASTLPQAHTAYACRNDGGSSDSSSLRESNEVTTSGEDYGSSVSVGEQRETCANVCNDAYSNILGASPPTSTDVDIADVDSTYAGSADYDSKNESLSYRSELTSSGKDVGICSKGSDAGHTHSSAMEVVVQDSGSGSSICSSSKVQAEIEAAKASAALLPILMAQLEDVAKSGMSDHAKKQLESLILAKCR